MSPEQARGHRVDQRSDIYSLGCVIFELFTGEVPFRGDTPVATILKQIHDSPPLEGRPGLPPALVPILRRALEKEPSRRYASAEALIDDLRDARISSGGGMAGEETSTATAVAFPRRPRPSLLTRASLSLRAVNNASLTTTLERLKTTGKRPLVAASFGLVLALVVTAVVALRPWKAASPAATPGVDRLGSPGAAAPVQAVRINALPWARLKLTTAGGGTVPGVTSDEVLTTPTVLALPQGEYAIELENGGLTPSLRESVRVESGGSHDFVFTMPGFDAEALANRLSGGP
jgi:hypothetical protein